MKHVEHVELAESLGYEGAWFYDSPALYGDLKHLLGPGCLGQ